VSTSKITFARHSKLFNIFLNRQFEKYIGKPNKLSKEEKLVLKILEIAEKEFEFFNLYQDIHSTPKIVPLAKERDTPKACTSKNALKI
jgi:hypothetical protein